MVEVMDAIVSGASLAEPGLSVADATHPLPRQRLSKRTLVRRRARTLAFGW